MDHRQIRRWVHVELTIEHPLLGLLTLLLTGQVEHVITIADRGGGGVVLQLLMTQVVDIVLITEELPIIAVQLVIRLLAGDADYVLVVGRGRRLVLLMLVLVLGGLLPAGPPTSTPETGVKGRREVRELRVLITAHVDVRGGIGVILLFRAVTREVLLHVLRLVALVVLGLVVDEVVLRP